MEYKTTNYKSPFGHKLKGSITAFKNRASEQAHTCLELNRLNIYIKKLQNRISSYEQESTSRGSRYRNLKRRLDFLKGRKDKLLEKGVHFFARKKVKR